MWEEGREVGARTALESGELRGNLPGQSSVKAQFAHWANDLIKGLLLSASKSKQGVMWGGGW